MENTIKTEKLPLYSGKEGFGTFRVPANVDEMEAHCAKHGHIWCRANGGDARRVKINGAVRRWKRDRTRIEVPIKYGLYEYATLTSTDIERVLIPV